MNRIIPMILIICCFLLSSCNTQKVSMENNEYSDQNSHLYGELVSAENVVYFIADDEEAGYKKIMYYDKATESCNSLCGKPECTHDSLTCNAVISQGSAFGLGLFHDKIYWIADKISMNDMYEGRFLYQMNPDGTERKEIRVISEPGNPDAELTGSVYVGYTDDYIILAGGRTVMSSGNQHYYATIQAFSFSDPKKDFQISDTETTGRLYLYVSGRNVYYSLVTQPERTEDQEWTQESHLQLSRFDIGTKNTEVLFDDDVSFCPWEFHPEDERIIISTMSDMNSLNKAYVLDLREKRITSEIDMEDRYPGITSYTDTKRISSYSHPNIDPNMYRIIIRDFEGNIISDQSGTDNMVTRDNMGRGRIYAGMDDDFSYYFFREVINGTEREWLMAYPVKGGAPKKLYTNVLQEEERDYGVINDDFSVGLTISTEHNENVYYIHSIDELKNTVVSYYLYNRTDDELADIYDKLLVNGRIAENGYATNWPSNTEDLASSETLDFIHEADFINGIVVLQYECRAHLKSEPEKDLMALAEVQIMLIENEE